MDLFAVIIILFIVCPILLVLSIPIAPIFYVIGVLIILGGLVGSIESEHKGAIIVSCLIIGVLFFLIGFGVEDQRVLDLLTYCPLFFG